MDQGTAKIVTEEIGPATDIQSIIGLRDYSLNHPAEVSSRQFIIHGTILNFSRDRSLETCFVTTWLGIVAIIVSSSPAYSEENMMKG
jgi:hypothetical protein